VKQGLSQHLGSDQTDQVQQYRTIGFCLLCVAAAAAPNPEHSKRQFGAIATAAAAAKIIYIERIQS